MPFVEDRIVCPQAHCSEPPPINEEQQPRERRPTLGGFVRKPVVLYELVAGVNLSTVAGIDQRSEAFGIGSLGVDLNRGRG